MKRVTTTATVSEDGVLTARVPDEVPPGEHQVEVLVEELPAKDVRSLVDQLHVWNWPPGSRFGRDELYDGDDDGR